MRIKHNLFLKWWLFITLVVVGSVFATTAGALRLLWENDFTFISFGLLAVFASISVAVGKKTWVVSKVEERIYSPGRGSPDAVDKDDLKGCVYVVRLGWFLTGLFAALGFFGTIVGFSYAFAGIDEINAQDVLAMQRAITSMGAGVSTALLTTATGLVCFICLSVQLFNISYALEEHLDSFEDQTGGDS